MSRNSIIVTIFSIISILLILAIVYLATLPPRNVTPNDIKNAIRYQPSSEFRNTSGNNTVKDSVIVEDTVHFKESVAVSEKETVKEVKPDVDTVYYIIVGSFKSSDQAKSRAAELQKNATDSIIVLPPTAQGNIRISYGKFPSLEKSKAVLDMVKAEIDPKAWVLKSGGTK